MNIVIDTSALLAVLLGEPERPALIAATRGATLCAPASVPWEVGNALSAMLKRRRLGLPHARRVVRAFEAIPLRSVPVDLGRALEVAAHHDLFAYDAYLLDAARAERCPLLTLDRTLNRAAADLGIRTLEVKA